METFIITYPAASGSSLDITVPVKSNDRDELIAALSDAHTTLRSDYHKLKALDEAKNAEIMSGILSGPFQKECDAFYEEKPYVLLAFHFGQPMVQGLSLTDFQALEDFNHLSVQTLTEWLQVNEQSLDLGAPNVGQEEDYLPAPENDAVDEDVIVIEVAMLTDEEMLDENDVDADGNCTVDGMYVIKMVGCEAAGVDSQERALDQFRELEKVSCESDFSVMARTATADEKTNLRQGGSYFRECLGSYTIPTYVPKPGM